MIITFANITLKFTVIDEPCRIHCWRRGCKIAKDLNASDREISEQWKYGGCGSYQGCVELRCPRDFCYQDSPCHSRTRSSYNNRDSPTYQSYALYGSHCTCPSGNLKDCQHPCETDPSACRHWQGDWKKDGPGDIGSYIGGNLRNSKRRSCQHNQSACRDPA